MFWDGTRWVDETSAKSTATPRPGWRRPRAFMAIVIVSLVALLIPFSGVAAATPITRLIDQWDNAAVVKTHSESSSLVTYKGSWPRRYHTDYRGNYARSAAVRGASATFRFKGSAVAWAGAVGPDRGRANVYIDGVFKKTVDLHATSFRAQNILYRLAFPRSASHTLKIVVLGTAKHPRVTVDGFIVRAAAPAAAVARTSKPAARATPRPATSPRAPAAGRPFAAPVTSRTVAVPSSIDASGASNAGAALASFLGSVPDGSVISFPAGGTYRLDRGLFISGRHNLVFEGNGATLRAAGPNTLIAASPFLIDGANSDIVVRNFTIEGNNPNTGTSIYDPGGENQQGVAIYGGTRIEIANTTIRKTWGDAVYANEKDTTHSWVDGLWVHDNTLRSIGRTAFTMNGARNALIERNNVDQIGGSVMDIEPDTAYQGATNITLRDNTVGVYGLTPLYTQWFVACANNDVGIGAVVHDIVITGNHVSGGASSTANTPNAGGLATWFGKSRTANITFSNNTTTKAGRGAVLTFQHVDGLTVKNNTQPLTSGSLMSITDSTRVSQ